MAKDYAKRVLTTSRKPKKKRFRIEFIAIPVLFVAFISGYWALTHHHSQSSSGGLLAKLTGIGVHKTQASKLEAKVADKSQEPDIHFDFYTQLPSMQVMLSPADPNTVSAAKVHAKSMALVTKESGKLNASPAQTVQEAKVTKKSDTKYILQFGQFRTASEATQMRISLLLAECETEVHEASIAGQKVFRVQRGPFINQAEVKKLQQQMQEKGVVCEVKKA